MSLDHTPIPIESFGGLYRRGYDGVATSDKFDNECPSDHFPNGQNFQFFGKVCGSRYGANKTHIISNVVRTRLYRRVGEATRTLILTYTAGVGKIYDSTNLSSAILTITGMSDFDSVSLFNSAWITPHNGVNGLGGEKIYIYTGSGTARAAAGTAPVGVITLTTSASVGSVQVGTHLVAVAFETSSGFITPPATPVAYVAPGGFKLHVANIPTGGASIVARHIIVSMVIAYDGNPFGFEMWFQTRIADNVTTSTDIDFFDSDLVSSADYLFDELTSIPAGVSITTYGTRLIIGGEAANPSIIRISKAGEPESISSSTGLMVVDPSEVGGVTCASEFQNNLYIAKGTHTYVTQDNGGDIDTWDNPTVDNGIGTPSPFGFSQILDNKGANSDFFLVASLSGLYLFNGVYVRPNLSYNVDEVWQRINKNVFHLVQVYIDTDAKNVYVTVPLDGTSNITHILVGNYEQGMNADDIRWSLWNFTSITIASIIVNILSTTGEKFLQVAGTSNVYSMLASQKTDDGIAINCFIRFYLAYLKEYLGWVHHFTEWRADIWGSGTLAVTVQGVAGVSTANGQSITLSDPNNDFAVSGLNFQNTKGSIKIAINTGSSWFKLNSCLLYAKALWRSSVR